MLVAIISVNILSSTLKSNMFAHQGKINIEY